ncbi:MAG TPA: FtsX-like permease family protein, partial [Chloroflexota bacterium]|nr:FtsX-like permease family protein [Chloroflexota bacterium]
LSLLAIRAWRWPIFLRLGLRQLPRRPSQTVLIVAGLMLSTALVAASLATGDTITRAIRSAAVRELGRLDEVVTFSPTARPGGAGGDPFSGTIFFPGEVAGRLASRLTEDPALRQDVEGSTPAIWLGCTMLDLTSRQTAPVSLRALPPDYPPVFGALIDGAGRPLSLASLTPGEVIVAGAARGALAVQEGDDLSCTALGVPMRWRVAAIAGSEGLGAGQGVSLYLPLAHLRAALGPGPTGGQAEAINQIWIANRGDAVSSATRSDRVVEAVRPALVDTAAMGEVRRLLARPELRAALAARRGNLPERAQRSLAELLAEVDRPAPESGTLDRLLRSQSLRNTLIGAARDTRDAELGDALSTTLQRATGFQVQPLKQQILEIAERAGNVITTIFLLFSLLSIAAGLLLVFLIFSLLAASRRSELGIARALGTGRGHLIAMFTFEGVAYALLAAVAGVPAGLLISRLLLALLLWGVESGRFGFAGVAGQVSQTVTWYAAPRSAVLAACLGLLLTVLTVSVAAWRVTRVTIVTAIRDLPDPPARPSRVAAWGWLGLLPAGGALVALGLAWGQTFPFALGVSCLVFFLGVLIARLSSERVGATAAGLLLAGYWALPFDAQQRLGLPRLASGIEIFGLAGVLMVAGAVWAISANGDLFLRLSTATLAALGRPAPALRLAAAHLWRHPFRTGVTTTMFALVVFMLTVMQVITAAAVQFHADPAITYGGWGLRGQLAATAAQRPETGAPERLAENPDLAAPAVGQGTAPAANPAPAVATPTAPPAAPRRAAQEVALAAGAAPELQPYVAAAGVRSSGFYVLTQLSAPAPTWGGYPVSAIDAGFAAGGGIPLQTRAPGYASDAAVWEAVAGDPSLAVIDANALPSPQLRGTTNLSTLAFSLFGLSDNQAQMEPLPLWIGNPGAALGGGAAPSTAGAAGATESGPSAGARKVTVIGVIDRRAAVNFRGLHVSPSLLQSLGPPLRPLSTRLFFRLQPGVDVNEARAALGAAFFAEGLQTEDLLERFQNESGPLLLASRMLQLFVGLGLFVGIAALGVISTRAAVERRQEIGVLRAIGLSRSGVAGSLLLEAALVVLLGSVLGIGLGLILCYNVFDVQFFDRFQQGLKLAVPWSELLLTVALTCAAALVATWLPARQASRVPPIAAIRES